MELTINLPDTVAEAFGKTDEAKARQLLESAAVEGYRSERLSRHQVRQMLGLTWHETEAFLARHNCYLRYSVSDLDKDRETLAKLLDR